MIVVGILPGKDNDPGLTFRADIVALDQEALVVFLPETPARIHSVDSITTALTIKLIH